MVIKQQLQVTNFAASLEWSQAGNPAITNIEWYNWQGQTEVTELPEGTDYWGI